MIQHRSNRLLWLGVALLAFACHDRDQPRPVENAPATPAPAAGLTPLTSRDGGAPAAAAEPSASAAQLPPGHPPIANHSEVGAHPPVAAGGSISGTVGVDAKHKADIKGGALFVIARNASTHQIVAVRREASTTLPLSYTLTSA